MQCYREHLEYIYSAVKIDIVESDNKTLCDLYRGDPDMKWSIHSLNDGDFFDGARIELRRTYLFCEQFVDGWAFILLGTSTVESDFSVIKFEKNSRTTLSVVCFDEILYYKQFHRTCNRNVWTLANKALAMAAPYCANFNCRSTPDLVEPAVIPQTQNKKWPARRGLTRLQFASICCKIGIRRKPPRFCPLWLLP